MKEDYFSQLDDYDKPFCEQIQHGSRLFVGSNSNPFDQFNPSEPPQILDIRDLKGLRSDLLNPKLGSQKLALL